MFPLLYCNNAKQRSRIVKLILFRIQPPAYRCIGRTGAYPQFPQYIQVPAGAVKDADIQHVIDLVALFHHFFGYVLVSVNRFFFKIAVMILAVFRPPVFRTRSHST